MTSSNKSQKKKSQSAQQQRKRGRPKTYSETWKKKLIVLRYCGLKLPVIIELLKSQGDDSLKPKIRRTQQIVSQLLTDGTHRLSTIDKDTARRLATFVRAAVNRTSNPTSTVHVAPSHPLRLLGTSVNSALRDRSSFPDSATSYPTRRQIRDKVRSSIADAPDVPKSNKPRMSHENSGSALNEVTTASAQSATTTKLSGIPHDVVAFEDRRSVCTSMSESSFRKILRRISFSSSFASDISSLAKYRYSQSSYASSGRSSLMAFSLDSFTKMSLGYTLERISTAQLEKFRRANNTLIRDCCLDSGLCVHKLFASSATSCQKHLIAPWSNLSRLLEESATGISIVARDHSILFYAARIAMATDAIISLIHCAESAEYMIDINATDDEGQTFLFSLDPRNLYNGCCKCELKSPTHSTHQSDFECLMFALAEQNFDFDCIDDYGRHFLSYITMSPYFDIEWLSDMTSRYDTWFHRVARVSCMRDCYGLFLIDSIVSNPSYSQLESEKRVPFLKPLRPSATQRLPLVRHMNDQGFTKRALQGEDDQGRTPSHKILWEIGDSSESSQSVYGQNTVYEASEINRYDIFGRTPVMDFLALAVATGVDEHLICEKINGLALHGLNVNARSRGGSTMLHFAAKNSLPHVVGTLLSLKAQSEPCDIAGLNAVDYARRAIRRSTQSKYPAELMGRSLRSVASLLSGGSKKNPTLVEDEQNLRLNEDHDLQSRQTLRILQSHNGSFCVSSEHTSGLAMITE